MLQRYPYRPRYKSCFIWSSKRIHRSTTESYRENTTFGGLAIPSISQAISRCHASDQRPRELPKLHLSSGDTSGPAHRSSSNARHIRTPDTLMPKKQKYLCSQKGKQVIVPRICSAMTTRKPPAYKQR
uniref:Uncharacterized protein n=1 Tax=Arundo donax TaxID=35708 RepID=A0A0A9GHN1_ARUDO